VRRALIIAIALSIAPQTASAEERVRTAPIVAGAITLGVTYSITTSFVWLQAIGQAGHTNERERSYTTWMSVPVAGPFVAIGYAGGTNEAFHRVFAIGSGALQATGLALIFYGLFHKRTVTPTVTRNSVGVAGEF